MQARAEQHNETGAYRRFPPQLLLTHLHSQFRNATATMPHYPATMMQTASSGKHIVIHTGFNSANNLPEACQP